MTKPSPWGGEPDELAPCPFCDHTALHWVQAKGYHAIRCAKCCGEGPPTDTKAEAIAAWNRRTPSDSNPGTLNAFQANDIHPSNHQNPGTPSQSPDGYEVQWRPRGSDTWDGGSAGVYRTPEIAAEVVQEFTDHETRVRPIAYLDGSQSPYPPDTGRTHWEGCWRERGHHACAIAKLDAAPATDARVEKLRETIEVVVGFMVLAEAGIMPMAEALESAVKCARIALGESDP